MKILKNQKRETKKKTLFTIYAVKKKNIFFLIHEVQLYSSLTETKGECVMGKMQISTVESHNDGHFSVTVVNTCNDK